MLFNVPIQIPYVIGCQDIIVASQKMNEAKKQKHAFMQKCSLLLLRCILYLRK